MLVIAATGNRNRNRWHVNHAAHKHKIWIWQLASVKLVKIAVENSPLIIFFFSYAHIIELVLSIWLLFLVLMKLSSMFQRQRKFIQSIPISRLNVWEIDSPFRYVCVNGHYSMVFKALYSMSLSILFNRKRKLYFINIWQLNEWMNEWMKYTQRMRQIKKIKQQRPRWQKHSDFNMCRLPFTKDCKVENKKKKHETTEGGKKLDIDSVFPIQCESVQQCLVFSWFQYLWDAISYETFPYSFFYYIFSHSLHWTLKACILL